MKKLYTILLSSIAIIITTSLNAQTYLPLSGGTLSGPLAIRDETNGGKLSVGSNANLPATIGLSPYLIHLKCKRMGLI